MNSLLKFVTEAHSDLDRWRVVGFDESKRKILNPALVIIDIRELVF